MIELTAIIGLSVSVLFVGIIVGGILFYKVGYHTGLVDQEREHQKSKWR